MEASLVFLLASLFLALSVADPIDDKQALLDFIGSISHGRNLNWKDSSPVCNNWTGVVCSGDDTRIVAVHLPGVGLNGRIPADTLGRLSALQILSLRSNGLTGPFPLELTRIKTLTGLYLQFNEFSGPLPSEDISSAWKNLTVLDLSFNAFNGSIPSSISNLTLLTSLNLANNSLSGELPNLNLPNLQQLNVKNNRLSGSVPPSLRRFPNSSFAGNNLSFATPAFLPPPATPPAPSAFAGKRKPRKLGQSAILGIVVGGCAVVFVFLALLLLVFCSKRKGEDGISGKLGQGKHSPEKAVAGSQDENNRLNFFEDCSYAFDLEDLLRASAEVLGKGTFGTAYKAVLEDATTVVVKRLKEVGVGKREFEQQMEVVGRIKHENVVELRAYYYSKDEKLMVYDYYSSGSVSSLLHGKRGEEGRTYLDWDARLRVAIGTARGISHIHAVNSGKFVHGNIKSSNIFLNSQLYGCVSDLGLAMLMNPLAPPVSRATGYRAPEVTDTRKASQSSDVYSFGVLLLELLTGKSPIQISGGEIIHLVRWVHSVVREEWTAEVFDVELMRHPNIQEELVEALKIAMACVVRMPEQRPKMVEVVKMIEDVRRANTANRPSLEALSDSSGQALPPPPVQVGGESSVQH